MLRDNLYELKEIGAEGGAYEALVGLLPQSGIYSAHFPGMPVTPGACLVQIACELASAVAGKPLAMVAASDIRFLVPVLPEGGKDLIVKLEGEIPQDEALVWSIRFLEGETLCARMKLSFKTAV